MPDNTSEDSDEIFSALSNPLRLRILEQIRQSQTNSSHLAKALNMTIQALQRHIDILIKSNLILRGVDGMLSLSTIGRVSLEQIPNFMFLSKHRKYFQDHTFSGIPKRLVQRLGDLNSCEFLEDQMHAWQRAKDLVAGAEKLLYGITTMPPIEFYVTAKDLLKKGVRFKILHSEDTIVAKGFSKTRQENGWVDAMHDGRVEELYVKHLPLTVVVTDKAAEILFAHKKTDLIDGGSLFYSTHPDFRAWCMELFNYYWDEVEKVSPPKLQEI